MKRIVLGFLLLAGCYGAHRDNPAAGDDVPTCGDTTCDDKPADSCIDSDTLASYSAECTDGACGYPMATVECGTDGCCGDHCCAPVPSNTSDFGGLESTGLVVAPPNGNFDTDTECEASSALGKCGVVVRTDLPEACVCRADEITIGSLRVKGKRALVLLAKKRVVVQTLLDVSGEPAVDGPGGGSRKYLSDTNGIEGGAGGSFGGMGNGLSVSGVWGTPTLEPLQGGMSGRSAGHSSGVGGGGGGGGALQITAGERIEVFGVINAGGGGGRYGSSSYGISGGSGGGSGGGILIEASTVVVNGVVVANGGGGGGGGGNSGSGGSGAGGGKGGFPIDPLVAAFGGSGNDGAGCPLYGYVSGGDGGFGAFGTGAAGYGGSSDYDSRCIGNASFVGGGGGGGGVGRIRINTTTGCQCGGTVSPAATFGMLVKQ